MPELTNAQAALMAAAQVEAGKTYPSEYSVTSMADTFYSWLKSNSDVDNDE